VTPITDQRLCALGNEEQIRGILPSSVIVAGGSRRMSAVCAFWEAVRRAASAECKPA
jgi:hypothetical protein